MNKVLGLTLVVKQTLFAKFEVPKVTLRILFWILNEHSVPLWEKYLSSFLVIYVFRKCMFCVQHYGPAEGVSEYTIWITIWGWGEWVYYRPKSIINLFACGNSLQECCEFLTLIDKGSTYRGYKTITTWISQLQTCLLVTILSWIVVSSWTSFLARHTAW